MAVRFAKGRVTPSGVSSELRYLSENADVKGRLLRWGMNPFNGGLLVSDWTGFRLYDALFAGQEGEVPRFEPALGAKLMVPYIGASPARAAAIVAA